eukprot:TRINITY_DN20205_c0_g1_i1.p1 TRINITY_DN20205_c0_g1~~TRINITY_DN20205_c0_g1_i1.p1  ORF type:complete len:311 (+),score=54.95 TRINITY_DN20205_c0_g1_i1:35-967(+)
MAEGIQWTPSRKLSMLPACLRNDACLSARPQLRRAMEDWWAGSLWDPRDSGKNFGEDFTCQSSMGGVLNALHEQHGEFEPLLDAVMAGDLNSAEKLLMQGANATHALHLALQSRAASDAIHLLAVWSEDLNVWMPEPVAVTWARSFCEDVLASGAIEPRRSMSRLDAVLSAGADINAIGRGCETALHIVARCLQHFAGQTGNSVSKTQREGLAAERALRATWHSLVARGADAGLLDGEGLTAVERLTREQCRDLLCSKRNTYAMRRYTHARLRGEDPSLSWQGCSADADKRRAFAPRPRAGMRSEHLGRL